MDLFIAFVIYPGLLPTMVLAVVFGIIVTQRRPVLPPDALRAFLTVDGFAALISIILAVSAMVYMPWPGNAAYSTVAGPLLMWAALEAAYLMPSLVAQMSNSPLVVRGAARSLQIGLAGRIVIWCCFIALYWANKQWSLSVLPATILAVVAALLALPAAFGIGMFRNDTALTGVMTTGLDLSTVAIMQIAADVRATVLLCAVTIQIIADDLIPNAYLHVAAILVIMLVSMVALRFLVRNQPFATLAAALRWCWWRALPPALVALLYLQFVVG